MEVLCVKVGCSVKVGCCVQVGVGVLCVKVARCLLMLLTGDLDCPHPWNREVALSSLPQRGGLCVWGGHLVQVSSFSTRPNL